MITFKFDLESQKNRYEKVKNKIKNRDFYQKLNFYVLPYMPEKFRNRVIFLPDKYNPEKIYAKQRTKIQKLESEWNSVKNKFIKELGVHFSEINSVDILISPSLYGSLGSYEIGKDQIQIYPRYDRSIVAIQKLIITSLVSFFNKSFSWREKQSRAAEIQDNIFPNKKSLIKILDTEFAGKLAEESAKYLEKLGIKKNSKVDLSNLNLTKKERSIFNILVINKNKLVDMDTIANEIWQDKVEEKYSLYAITTLIKKLKKKVKEKTGRNLIHSQRGTGYILHI